LYLWLAGWAGWLRLGDCMARLASRQMILALLRHAFSASFAEGFSNTFGTAAAAFAFADSPLPPPPGCRR